MQGFRPAPEIIWHFELQGGGFGLSISFFT